MCREIVAWSLRASVCQNLIDPLTASKPQLPRYLTHEYAVAVKLSTQPFEVQFHGIEYSGFSLADHGNAGHSASSGYLGLPFHVQHCVKRIDHHDRHQGSQAVGVLGFSDHIVICNDAKVGVECGLDPSRSC